MDRKFEQGNNSEPLGVPEDLFTDPAKYDGGIPHWKRTIGFLKQYQVSKPKGREVITDQFTAFMLKDLRTIPQIMQNLELVLQTKPDLFPEDLFKQVAKSVDARVTRRTDLQSWTPDKIETLFQLGVDYTGTISELTRRIKWRLFNAPKNIDEAVDLNYNAALAMVTTEDTDVREEIFSLLCFEQPTFQPNSPCAIYFSIAGFDSDRNMGRNNAVMGALDVVGMYLETVETKGLMKDSSRTMMRVLYTEKIWKNSQEAQAMLQEIMPVLRRKNPERYDKVVQVARALGGKNYSLLAQYTNDNYLVAMEKQKALDEKNRTDRWPGNIFEDLNDPLRRITVEKWHRKFAKSTWASNKYIFVNKMGYRQLTTKPITIGNFVVELLGRNIQSREQQAALIREVLETIQTGECPNSNRILEVPMDRVLEAADVLRGGLFQIYDKNKDIVFHVSKILPEEEVGRLSSIIEYHRPLISPEQVSNMQVLIANLREEINMKFTRAIGKRGYQSVIADPSLRSYGYKSITFIGIKDDAIEVKINIEGQEYNLTLDKEYRIIPGGDFEVIQTAQDKAWLELLTLEHLKKVMCVDEDHIQDELIGGQKQYERYRRQLTERIEHLRRLPSGQNFSTEAFTKCLRSHLPMRNLLEINRLRAGINWGGTLRTGIWTYVSGIEKDIDTQTAKPIKIAFSGVSDDLRKVVPLGEISPEEVSRIEQEILKELETI